MEQNWIAHDTLASISPDDPRLESFWAFVEDLRGRLESASHFLDVVPSLGEYDKDQLVDYLAIFVWFADNALTQEHEERLIEMLGAENVSEDYLFSVSRYVVSMGIRAFMDILETPLNTPLYDDERHVPIYTLIARYFRDEVGEEVQQYLDAKKYSWA